ncbi:MAG: glycosyltransferase [Sporolactobacillus sp.]|jgi:teichuronic acid biosynthesis glycosyltransferase TuaH|nr:glycosyltransferase [Sporolactobacillus sp.]
MKKKIHVIVAAAKWSGDRLKYRRHRLAEFLNRQQDTEEVFWLCPSPDFSDPGFDYLSGGIAQWALQDLLPYRPFRFCRFIDFFYRKKLSFFQFQLQHLIGHYRFFLWYTCPVFPLLAERFPWDRIIYDCSDLWTASISGDRSLANRLRRLTIARAQQRIVAHADTIFCTSDDLHRQIAESVGPEKATHIFTIENGVDYDLFQRRARAAQVLPDRFNGTILGYVGGIKDKLDFELIRQAARIKKDWLFLFVGPDRTGTGSTFKRMLTEEDNVLWTGSVDPEEVPNYVNLLDIGIMPYKASPYNQAVFPLKLFEFLAAGRPAIGVNLPSTTKYAADGVYISLEGSDAEMFIHACSELEGLKGHADLVAVRKNLAKTKDWHTLFRQMLDRTERKKQNDRESALQ